MTSESAPLDPNVASLCFYRRGEMCGFLASAPSPCQLCPNWRSWKYEEGREMTWFDLPRLARSMNGIQQVFSAGQATTLLERGDDAVAGAPAVAEPLTSPRRSLEDW